VYPVLKNKDREKYPKTLITRTEDSLLPFPVFGLQPEYSDDTSQIHVAILLSGEE
jgi:hypothetical protein